MSYDDDYDPLDLVGELKAYRAKEADENLRRQLTPERLAKDARTIRCLESQLSTLTAQLADSQARVRELEAELAALTKGAINAKV